MVFIPRVFSKVCSWATFSPTRAFQGSILGSGFWYVRTLGGLGWWPNVIFVEFLARHMVRPVSSLGASSRSLPPGHFRVPYLAPASGMCGPSVASGNGPSCIFNASGRESEKKKRLGAKCRSDPWREHSNPILQGHVYLPNPARFINFFHSSLEASSGYADLFPVS